MRIILTRRKDRKVTKEQIRKTERTLTVEQYNIEYIEDFIEELGYEIDGEIRLTQRANVCNMILERYEIGDEGYVVFNFSLDNQEWFNDWILKNFLQ